MMRRIIRSLSLLSAANAMLFAVLAVFFIGNFWMAFGTAFVACANFGLSVVSKMFASYGEFGDDCDAE